MKISITAQSKIEAFQRTGRRSKLPEAVKGIPSARKTRIPERRKLSAFRMKTLRYGSIPGFQGLWSHL